MNSPFCDAAAMSSSNCRRSVSSRSSSSSNQAKPFAAGALGRVERDVALRGARPPRCASASIEARPIEADTWTLRAADEDRRSTARARMAFGDLFGRLAVAPSSSTANSSPPMRAQQRRFGRGAARSCPRRRFSSWSPARWPWRSLTRLKWSRSSSSSTPAASPSSASSSERISSRRLARPVVGSVLALRWASRSAAS